MTSRANAAAARGRARVGWWRDGRLAFVLLGLEGLVLVAWQIHAGADPWTIASAPSPFTRPLAVCRGGLLLAVLWALVAVDSRRKVGCAVMIVTVFAGSAVALALYVPAFLLAMAVVVAYQARDAESHRRSVIAGWSLLTVSMVLFAAQPRQSPLPGTPAQNAMAWLERDNLFRAHWEAAKWSALERANGTLGAGTLLRAELEHRLGRTAHALDTLAEIRSTNATPETQRRAAILFASWAKEEQSRSRSSGPAAPPATR